MPLLLTTLAAFILLHVGLSATGARAVLVRGLGEGPYRGLFSLISAALLVGLVISYPLARDSAENLVLWAVPARLKHTALLIVLLGVTLAVAGILSPGPTLAGFEGMLHKPEPARGAQRLTRHPFLWGVALWALGHLLGNGELVPLLLFGGLGVMVLFGTRSIDRKGAARDPAAWAAYAAVTSNLPFAAIAQGRNRFVLGELWWRLVLGLGAGAGLYLAHPYLFGVNPG